MEGNVHPKERIYFLVSVIVSIILYLLMVVSIVGIVYILTGALVGLFVQGLYIGHLKGNGVRLSEEQFPETYSLAKKLSNEMDFVKMPEIYVLESGGLLNAFATRFMGRNFVVIYADILELAYAQGEDAVAFVICHELAHIKRKHLSYRWLIFPSTIVPFLGSAYSRACEYTCDRMGAYHVPQGAIQGLLVLAAGKKLYRNVNIHAIEQQVEEEGGFWVWLYELMSTHPNLLKRIKVLKDRLEQTNYQLL